MKLFDVDHLDISYNDIINNSDYITRVGPITRESILNNRITTHTAEQAKMLNNRVGCIFSTQVWPRIKPTKNNTFDKSWNIV